MKFDIKFPTSPFAEIEIAMEEILADLEYHSGTGA